MTRSVRSTACRRFERLSSDALDRELSVTEFAFLDEHRFACDECRRTEEQGALALNMLRQLTLEPDADEGFDRRVIRRVQTQTVREGFRYWSPVAIGATLAMIGVLAVLQVALRPDSIPERNSPSGEARLDRGYPAVPDLAAPPKLAP